MTRRSATLRDVAERVGVHLSTVSRALDPRTRHLITPELAERILQAAGQLQYRPNAMAYSLRTRRSRSVGVLIPDITNPIFPPIVRGLEDVLAPLHYVTLIVNTDNDPDKAAEAVAKLQSRGVDGLVVACATRHDPMIARLLAEHLPVVVVNRTSDLPGLGGVIHDEARGMAAVVAHLVGLGHRRLGHTAGPDMLSTGAGRLAAFRAALACHGLPKQPSLIVQAAAFTEEEGRRCAGLLLDQPRPPTAIVGGNDLLALGAVQALRARGLGCPDDVSVTGYNDMAFVDRLEPPLTTVRIATYEAGRRAGRLILEQIEGKASAPVEILPVELIVRGSTGPARPGGN
jgi:LacI family transcriptional regulator, galactose operon repressor